MAKRKNSYRRSIIVKDIGSAKRLTTRVITQLQQDSISYELARSIISACKEFSSLVQSYDLERQVEKLQKRIKELEAETFRQ